MVVRMNMMTKEIIFKRNILIKKGKSLKLGLNMTQMEIKSMQRVQTVGSGGINMIAKGKIFTLKF